MSEHPVAAHAVGEISGSLLEQLDGARADLVVAFVSPHFAGTMEDVGGVLRTVLAPEVLLGSTHAAIVGMGREVEGSPAISVWAASFGATRVQSVELNGAGIGPAGTVAATEDHTLLLLADPFSFPIDEALAELGDSRPGLQVIGGMASAASGPGGNRLLIDGNVRDRGAVGVLLAGPDPITAIVSQGCRPIGQPFVVTDVEGPYVRQLGGLSALERLQDIAATMSETERQQLHHGLQVGLVVDEHRLEFGRGDFLVRNVMGARADDGAIAVGARVEVGQTLQFQVRDAIAADVDLRQLLAGHDPAGGLLFSCTGRGQRFFGRADHDAAAISDLLGPIPLAGGFCAGEIGPVGAVNYVHGFSASVALFA